MKRDVVAVVAAALLVLGASPVSAGATDPSRGSSVTGAAGQRLTVSVVDHLDAAGQTLQVTGSGYQVDKGIYVAFCVRPPAGQVPTPCGGRAATTGSSSSAWVSSNPPSYGKGLAVPFGTGGTFSVSMHVSARLNDTIDCRRVTCAVVTRADHTRTSDRSQDVVVALSFGAPNSTATPLIVGGSVGGAVLLVLIGSAIYLLRHRQRADLSESS